LDAIGELNTLSVLLIDDARLFLCPPPEPHDAAWPSLSEVLVGLSALSSEHEPMVINDVIVYFPSSIRADLFAYASRHSVDWLAVMHRVKSLEAQREALEKVLDERLALIVRLDGELKDAQAWRHETEAH
jgi:hypothetical protein